MKKIKKWFGLDNNSVSLFSYGLLLRWVSKFKEYQVCYHCGCDTVNDEVIDYYTFSWFDPMEWKKLMIANLGTDRFPSVEYVAKMNDMTVDEILDESNDWPENLLFELTVAYGVGPILDYYNYDWYDENKIRRILNKAVA
ncbi:hypothetical protein [Parabacteroides merdae]|jgi:hypothetical protein|uniref:hypothetical protein n=1 Tax=Parabacteroides merdae TaxID=46503 RepID=UPI0034A24A9C